LTSQEVEVLDEYLGIHFVVGAPNLHENLLNRHIEASNKATHLKHNSCRTKKKLAASLIDNMLPGQVAPNQIEIGKMTFRKIVEMHKSIVKVSN